ncbi:hypothetical protein [Muriicola marianensis]|uniref:DUF2798 domain-containing protein n=1 Tax=Muriicola marianensis TaxID=1324801 RepID=A0ABQ1R4Z9_9FLAO|nr:hypothetical protein [Muriicola marianensis]GGD57356.1 hypothetical protein GCM10011361_24840 [Muriicola marianensis]
MKKSLIGLFLSLGVCALSIYLLVTASPALEYPLGENDTVPLGSFITWAGLISLPMSLYCGVRRFREPQGFFYRSMAVALKIVIVLAFLWVPISYGLAGNMNFNFGQSETFQGGQTAMSLFWGLSLGIPLGTIVLFAVHLIIEVFQRLFHRRK